VKHDLQRGNSLECFEIDRKETPYEVGTDAVPDTSFHCLLPGEFGFVIGSMIPGKKIEKINITLTETNRRIEFFAIKLQVLKKSKLVYNMRYSGSI